MYHILEKNFNNKKSRNNLRATYQAYDPYS